MATNQLTENPTALAFAERRKLIKSLRRFDMVFFTVCAFVGLGTPGTVASSDAEGFTWLIFLALVGYAAAATVRREGVTVPAAPSPV